MTSPSIPDPAETQKPFDPSARIQGWTPGEWLDYVRRRPTCTLPGGVGAALVQLLEVRPQYPPGSHQCLDCGRCFDYGPDLSEHQASTAHRRWRVLE